MVVKVRPRGSRLVGCAVVHRALWTAGFPCPEPLVDVQPLNGYAASAETLVPDVGEPPADSELAVQSAAALARLVELAPDPSSVLSLAPSPSWAGWDHTEPGLWPRPEDRDADLNACQEPQWLDRVAAAVRDRLAGHAGDPVIGHGDGSARWRWGCPRRRRRRGSRDVRLHPRARCWPSAARGCRRWSRRTRERARHPRPRRAAASQQGRLQRKAEQPGCVQGVNGGPPVGARSASLKAIGARLVVLDDLRTIRYPA